MTGTTYQLQNHGKLYTRMYTVQQYETTEMTHATSNNQILEKCVLCVLLLFNRDLRVLFFG